MSRALLEKAGGLGLFRTGVVIVIRVGMVIATDGLRQLAGTLRRLFDRGRHAHADSGRLWAMLSLFDAAVPRRSDLLRPGA